MTNLTDNSWSFLDNLSNDEQMLLHEATKLYAEDLGLSKREILTCNINNVKELLCEKASLDGASYETFLSSIMEGLGLDTKGDVIQNEDAIFLEMLVYVIDQCNEEQLKKYAKSHNYLYQGKDKLKEAVRLRAKALPIFDMEIPATILAPIAKSSASPSTIPFLAISAMYGPIIAISALLAAKGVSHVFTNLTGGNKKGLILHFCYLISAIISISRASRTKFTSEDQVLEYIDGIIRNNTRWEDSKKTALSIFADFCLSEGSNDFEECTSLVQEVLGEDWHIIPQKILRSLDDYRDIIVDKLMRRLNDVDKYAEQLYDVEEFCKGKERVLFAEFKFPITPIDIRYCYEISDEKNNPVIYCSIGLYQAYKRVDLEFYDGTQKSGFDGVCCFDFQEKYREEITDIIRKMSEDSKDKVKYYKIESSTLNSFTAEALKSGINQEEIEEYFQFILHGNLDEVESFSEAVKRLIKEEENNIFTAVFKPIFALRHENELLKKKEKLLKNMLHLTKHDLAPVLGNLKVYVDKKHRYKIDSISTAIEDIVFCADTNEEEIDIVPVVNNFIEKSKKSINRKCSIVWEEAPVSPINIIANTSAVDRILNNILENAERHGFSIERPTSMNKIRISHKLEDKKFRLSIANNGKPFSGDTIDVFRKGCTYGITGHNGDGLYFVNELMTLMGGSAKFLSHPNNEFSVELELTFKTQEKL